MKYKFKINDKVRIIKGGSGCHPDEIGKIVTIESLGVYNIINPGYKIAEKKLNTNSKSNGFIGENSFELAEEYVCPFKVGDQVILTKTEKIPEESYNWTTHLSTNIVYTVSEITTGQWIHLKEGKTNLGYHPKKFKLAENKKLDIDEKALNLKVGDKIKILTRPSKWSSLCNSNNPLRANIEYPYICTIKKIKAENTYIGFTCGDYGWCISEDSKLRFELINDSDSDNDGSYQCWSESTPSKYTEISFENFKPQVINVERNVMKKYLLIEPIMSKRKNKVKKRNKINLIIN